MNDDITDLFKMNRKLNSESKNNKADDSNSFDIKKKRISILETYGEEFTKKEYITNPAIGRESELKELMLILLTPDKSAILTGKPGVGKTAIVEGLAYLIERGKVPDALKNYRIIKVNTSALLGIDPITGESKIQNLIDELKLYNNLILFIDEIHTLMGSGKDALDFANMFKPGLDRGDIKVIGATTTAEYEQFLLKDKAFLRRFEKIEVEEPNQETTVKILVGTTPKIEATTGVKWPYTSWLLEQVCKFLVNMTSEYKRIYENGSRYPDVSLALLSKCFTYARFENSEYVTFKHIYEAIVNCNSVYDDVIKKELIIFKETFKDWLEKENVEIN